MLKYLLSLVLSLTSAQALVLENLIKAGELQKTLANKKVGYYIGSFDPLHLGHQDIVQISLDKQLVDYVLILPNWGGDSYKTRIPINYRLKMLFAVFKGHPQVIVTKLSPQEVQKCLTLPDMTHIINDKPTVKSAFEGTEFIGLIGSDSAMGLAVPENNQKQEQARKKQLSVFMRGIKVPEKHAQGTIGGFIALPVDTFIVAQREGDDLTSLKGKVGDRPILAIIQSTAHKHASSTLVKKTLKEHKPIDQMVDAAVIKIIEEDRLYQ